MSSDTWHEYDPTTTAPFDRDFVYGVYDCYSLIDYLLELGVHLPQWERGKWGSGHRTIHPFDDNAKAVGKPSSLGATGWGHFAA